MKSLRSAFGEAIGLFIDDGSLAGGVAAWVLMIWLLREILVGAGWWSAGLLFLGLAALLLENVIRTGRQSAK